MDIGGGAEVVTLEYMVKRDEGASAGMIKDLKDIQASGLTGKAAMDALGQTIKQRFEESKRLADDLRTAMSKLPPEILAMEKAMSGAGAAIDKAHMSALALNKAFDARAMNDAHASANSMNKAFDAAAQSTSLFGAASKAATAEASGLASQLGPLGSSMAALGPVGLAAAAAIALMGGAIVKTIETLASWTVGVVDAGSKLDDLKMKTDVSYKALQEWAFAGKDVGVSAETIATAAVRLSSHLAEGTDKTRETIHKLGLSFDDLKQMKPEEQFNAVARAIQDMGNSGEQALAAQALGFGRSGEMLKLLRSDLDGARMAAHDAGAVMSDETIAAADKLGDSAAHLGEAWDGFKASVVDVIVKNEDLARGFETVVKALGTVSRFIRDNQDAIDTWGAALGAAVASPGFVLLMKWLESFTKAVEQARIQIDLMKVAMGDVGDNPNVKLPKLFTPGGMGMPAQALSSEDADKLLNRGLVEEHKQNLDAIKKATEDAVKAAEREQKAFGEIIKKQAELDRIIRQAHEHMDADVRKDDKEDTREQAAAMNQALRDEIGLRMQLGNTNGVLVTVTHNDQLRAAAQADIQKHVLALRDAEVSRKAALVEVNRELQSASGIEKKHLEQIKAQIEGESEHAKKMLELRSVMGIVGAALTEMSGHYGGFAGEATSALGMAASAWEHFGDAVKKGATASDKARAAVSAAMGALAIYDQNKHELNAGAGTLHGAESGAAAGSQFGAVGAIIGAVAGGLIGLFSGSKFRKLANDAGKTLGFEVSKELAEAIEKTMKDLGVNVKTASLLNLDKAIATSNQPITFFKKQVSELMVGIAAGSIPAKQGIEQLGKAFSEVTKQAEAGDKAAQRMAAQMIQSARATGVKVPEIAAAVKSALDASMEGLKDFTANFTIVTPEDAKAEALIFGSTFWAKVQEDGIVAAGTALLPAWDAMQQALKDSGVDPATVAAILAPMQGIFDALGDETTKKMVAGLDGATRAVKGLSDAGYLTKGAFEALGTVAQSTFDQMTAAGVDSNAALMALAPTLAQIQSDSQKYGLTIDDNTQALIDQAKAAGVAFPTDPLLQVVDLLGEIVVLMGGTLPEAVKRSADAFNQLGNAAGNAGQEANNAFGGGFGGEGHGQDSGGGSSPGYAVGGTVHAPASGQQITVHGTEHIIRPEQLDGMLTAAAAKAMRTTGGAGGSQPIVVKLVIGEQQLAQAVIDMRRRGSAAFGR